VAEVIAELIVSVDMKAKGERSPGYYGYLGPELKKWFETNHKKPFRQLLGRKTYELLNALPENARDEGWHELAGQPGYLFSSKLDRAEWPGLEIIDEDMVGFVRRMKHGSGPEFRVLGSLSLGRQLAEAGLLDCLRLIVCPLALPESGIEPVFDGWPDVGFKLSANRLLDDRVMILDYRPAGKPPSAN
jgi:dihydrofolate reductase